MEEEIYKKVLELSKRKKEEEREEEKKREKEEEKRAVLDKIGEVSIKGLLSMLKDAKKGTDAITSSTKFSSEGIKKSLKELTELERRALSEEEEVEREEIQKPLSERLSQMFYHRFGKQSRRVMSMFGEGLEKDLYAADIRVTPMQYSAFMFGMAIVAGILSSILFTVFLAFLNLAFMGPALGIFTAFFTLILVRRYPRMRAASRGGNISRALPYVLRHMATQLAAGMSLLATMKSVANAGYGVISEEFDKTLGEIYRGASVETALENLADRCHSDGLQRVLQQVLNTLKTGGDLATTLETIADDIAFELRSKLRDYVQKLNTFSMLYMFLAIIAPTMIVILSTALSLSTGSMAFPISMMAILLLVGFPFISFFLVFAVKMFEPKV